MYSLLDPIKINPILGMLVVGLPSLLACLAILLRFKSKLNSDRLELPRGLTSVTLECECKTHKSKVKYYSVLDPITQAAQVSQVFPKKHLTAKPIKLMPSKAKALGAQFKNGKLEFIKLGNLVLDRSEKLMCLELKTLQERMVIGSVYSILNRIAGLDSRVDADSALKCQQYSMTSVLDCFDEDLVEAAWGNTEDKGASKFKSDDSNRTASSLADDSGEEVYYSTESETATQSEVVDDLTSSGGSGNQSQLMGRPAIVFNWLCHDVVAVDLMVAKMSIFVVAVLIIALCCFAMFCFVIMSPVLVILASLATFSVGFKDILRVYRSIGERKSSLQ